MAKCLVFNIFFIFGGTNLNPKNMNKVQLAAALFFFAFTSCKKDYTCECTTTSPAGTTVGTTNLGKMTKKNAETKCNETDASYTYLGKPFTVECSVK